MPYPSGMATSAEIQAELTLVSAAITSILSGGALQSYSIGGRQYSIAPLAELWKRKRELQGELAETDGSSSVLLASFKGSRP